MHAAGAVEPVAAGAGPRSTTRSEIAGVVTTDGPADTGTGRSITRVVQAPSAADAMITARIAFIRCSSLSGWTPLVKLDQVALASVRAAKLQCVWGLQSRHEGHRTPLGGLLCERGSAGLSLGRQERHGSLFERAAARGREGDAAADRREGRAVFGRQPGVLQRALSGRAHGRAHRAPRCGRGAGVGRARSGDAATTAWARVP